MNASLCRDKLAGTDVYGAYEPSPTSANTFSIAFQGMISEKTDVLFMTGDRTQFLVTTYGTINVTGDAIDFAPLHSSSAPCVFT
jgi:hypothetical protein